MRRLCNQLRVLDGPTQARRDPTARTMALLACVCVHLVSILFVHASLLVASLQLIHFSLVRLIVPRLVLRLPVLGCGGEDVRHAPTSA